MLAIVCQLSAARRFTTYLEELAQTIERPASRFFFS
jgi:hypothetical protein